MLRGSLSAFLDPWSDIMTSLNLLQRRQKLGSTSETFASTASTRKIAISWPTKMAADYTTYSNLFLFNIPWRRPPKHSDYGEVQELSACTISLTNLAASAAFVSMAAPWGGRFSVKAYREHRTKKVQRSMELDKAYMTVHMLPKTSPVYRLKQWGNEKETQTIQTKHHFRYSTLSNTFLPTESCFVQRKSFNARGKEIRLTLRYFGR